MEEVLQGELCPNSRSTRHSMFRAGIDSHCDVSSRTWCDNDTGQFYDNDTCDPYTRGDIAPVDCVLFGYHNVQEWSMGMAYKEYD